VGGLICFVFDQLEIFFLIPVLSQYRIFMSAHKRTFEIKGKDIEPLIKTEVSEAIMYNESVYVHARYTAVGSNR
jgi:hypothetical protein